MRLVPGNPDASSVMWRMETDSDARMPPFGAHADPDGIALVREWIRELETCP